MGERSLGNGLILGHKFATKIKKNYLVGQNEPEALILHNLGVTMGHIEMN